MCGVLPFIFHAARCFAAFLDNGFTPLIRLDITDHTCSIVLIFGLFAGYRRTSFSQWQEIPGCMRCCPILHKYSCMCQRMVISVWLNIRPGDFINIILCIQASVNMVRVFFRELSMIMQLLYRHTQLNPTWNRKSKRLLCLLNSPRLTRRSILLKSKTHAYQYFYFGPPYLQEIWQMQN